MKTLSEAIVNLFDKEMFYAEVISQMRRVSNPTLQAVAGVCIKEQIELHINFHGVTIPEQRDKDGRVIQKEHRIPGFNDLPMPERVAVLKHECEHILRDHIPRSKELHPEVYEKKKTEDQIEDIASSMLNSAKHMTMNVAADCAINYSIADGGKDWCYPKTFGLKDGETFEWYLEQLKNNEKMKGMNHFDGHSLWAESTGAKELLKEKVRQAVNKAAKRTRAAGKMTADMEMIVADFNNANTVNWREQLRRFVAHTVETTIEATRKKRNRRHGIHIPGSRKIEELHIGVVKDSSGSVSDEAYSQFMNEIDNIAKYAKVTMVDADCEVKSVEKYKKGQPRVRKGYGGTAYQPAFDYFNKVKDIDAVIYFGDMDSSDTPAKPKYPVLWAIVGNQEPPADFGVKIRIVVEGGE